MSKTCVRQKKREGREVSVPVLLGPVQKAFSCANSLTDSGCQVLRREVPHSLRTPLVEDGDCEEHEEH